MASPIEQRWPTPNGHNVHIMPEELGLPSALPARDSATLRGAVSIECALAHASPRARLKQATDDVHRRLHRHPRLRQLADGSVDNRNYRRILMRFYGFYATFEPLVRDPIATDRLRQDLSDLGLSPTDIDALPRCVTLPHLSDPCARLGAAYVLEGAAAGGRLMAAALTRRKRELPVPLRFLSGDGDPDRWGAFVRLLERELPDFNKRETAAAAARDTFLALETWMDDGEQAHG